MNLLITITGLMFKFLYYVTEPFFAYMARGKKKTVPAIHDDLLMISATDLAEKIRQKKISCEEVCRSYIDRIKEVNPLINAVIEERFEEAIKEAKNVDDYLTKSSLNPDDLKKIKPLLGVPLTVKESCSLKGMSFAVGAKSRMGFRAETDSEVVSRLKFSGAIPLLVSSTPELCLSFETHTLLNGTTNNPYDTTRTAGGSSGGEGALLGAGASLIGIGSDIAGSIRLPSMFNGVFGHKSTPKISPIKGQYPNCDDEKYPDFLVFGPLTRYAKDLKLMMRVIAGKKANSVLKLNEEVDLSEVNLFFLEETQDTVTFMRVEEDIKDVIRKSVDWLEKSCGMHVSDMKFDEINDSIVFCASQLYRLKGIPNLLKSGNDNLALELLKCLAGQSSYPFNTLYFYLLEMVYQSLLGDYSAQCKAMKKTFLEKLGENGVFICPSWTSSADRHHRYIFTVPSSTYIILANVLGLPATHVPCGLDKNGLPIGVQVIAAPNQDRLCFAVAEKLEEGFGGWRPPN